MANVSYDKWPEPSQSHRMLYGGRSSLLWLLGKCCSSHIHEGHSKWPPARRRLLLVRLLPALFVSPLHLASCMLCMGRHYYTFVYTSTLLCTARSNAQVEAERVQRRCRLLIRRVFSKAQPSPVVQGFYSSPAPIQRIIYYICHLGIYFRSRTHW